MSIRRCAATLSVNFLIEEAPNFFTASFITCCSVDYLIQYEIEHTPNLNTGFLRNKVD